jgi:hypothetical protein
MSATLVSIDAGFWNFVAQCAHFSTTYALTLTAMLFTKMQSKHRWMVVFGSILLYAGVHEFILDPIYENAATRGSDLEDFCFLVAGSVVAEIAAHFKFGVQLYLSKGVKLVGHDG